jgi:hypothetical protein
MTAIERSSFGNEPMTLTVDPPGWSDDFDGNLDDWRIFGANFSSPEVEWTYGNFSVDDDYMLATGPEYNIAEHNSTVAFGTWKFDILIADTGFPEIIVSFISDDHPIEGPTLHGYCFVVSDLGAGETGTIGLIGFDGGHEVTRIGIWDDPDVYGWKEIVITRESGGQFYLYVNGTLRVSGTNNDVTTSEYFYFETMAGAALDNITVWDTSIEYDKAPPRWVESPTDQEIQYGQDFCYDLNATDISGIGEWTINNTAEFEIDSDGVITNLDSLELGTYSLTVSVSDTLGYIKTGTFTLTVVEEPPAQTDMTLILIAGGGAVIVLVLVVIAVKKRGS